MAANNAPRIALTIIGESVNFDERFPAETGFTETGIGTFDILPRLKSVGFWFIKGRLQSRSYSFSHKS